MPWDSTFTLVRPDDLVVIDVTTELLEPRPTLAPRGSARFALHVVNAPNVDAGFLRLSLQPQQVLEYAADDDGDVTPAAAPIFTDRSEIVLRLDKGAPPIEASVAGILDAARRLPLVVAPAPALGSPSTPSPDQPGTRFDLPYLLRMRPPAGDLHLVHPAEPVEQDGRVGLWSSQLILRPSNGDDPALRVWFDRLSQQVATNDDDDDWATATSPLTLNHTLDPFVADNVAQQSQHVARVVAEDLRVSTLGGWADVRGRWPNEDVIEYTHRLSMGRDEQQTVGITGRLMPFGHRALFTSETVRRFESDRFTGRRAAALVTEATITVIDRFVYPTSRALPFRVIEMVTKATPPGTAKQPTDAGSLGSGMKILTVHDRPFHFTVRATDHAGAIIDFELPLLFVPDPDPDVGDPPELADDDAVLPVWAKQGTSFTTLNLDGQRLTVTPPTGAASDDELVLARSNGAVQADVAPVTSVLARTLSLAPTTTMQVPGLDPAALADLKEALGTLRTETIAAVVPTLDRFVPSAGQVALGYALPYLKAGFDGDNKDAQVFLELAETELHKTVVGLGGEAVGGLAKLALPVTALSRQSGAVVGAVQNLLEQKPDLSFLETLDELKLPKLLGVVPMKDLIPKDVSRTLGDAPKIVSDVLADGKVSKDLSWSTELFKPDEPSYSYVSGRVVIDGFTTSDVPKPLLTIKQQTTLDPGGEQLHSRSEVTVEGFALNILTKPGSTEALVRIPFKKFSFVATDGTKPDFDVTLAPLEFGGILRYIRPLIDLIDVAGFSDPPALDVTDKGVLSSFKFPVPSLAIGAFTLQNITIGAELEIFFAERAPELRLFFSRESDPFRLTVAFLGGGGWLELTLSTGGLEGARGALEFGAAAALDVVVATVSVEAMGGVKFQLDATDGISIEAYLRLRGHVDVAGLISADLLLLLILLYVPADNLLIGHGELVLQLKVLFVSESLRVPVTRKFAGGNADPTFAELMAPVDHNGPPPWDVYCTAFVEE